MLPDVNAFKDEISGLIAERREGAFDIAQKVDLVASSTSRVYAFPSDMLDHLSKVGCMFVDGDAYIPLIGLKSYDRSETESEIVANFANVEGSCFYFVRRNAILILSGTISAVTNGLRIIASMWPADLTGLTDTTTDISANPSTTTLGFPRQFHELLARRVAIEWKGSRPKPQPLSPLEQNYEIDLERKLAAYSRADYNLAIIGEPPAESSVEYKDSGWDL